MKTVILGLDGATFDLIRPLEQQGRVPVLSRLMKEGVASPLRSTLLPNSFPGWASCTTGTSEGMHGVFSPFIKEPGGYGVHAMSGRDIMTRTVWDFLTDAGGRSLLLNIPTTYPPAPLNGVMVTGMLTPGLESDFTYPKEMKEEMLAAIPAYVIEPGRHPDKRKRAEEFKHANDMHELATHFLMDRGDWDFLMVVFSILDRAQHDFWADMDQSHPRHDPKTPPEFRGLIEEVYTRLDRAVGGIVEKLPADSRLFVVSDHGFCAELMEVRVNEALAASGLLSFKSGSFRKERAGFRALKQKVGRRLGRRGPAGNVLDKKVAQRGGFLDEIDWSRTRAYFAQDKGVWVNLEGREASGIVKESDLESVVVEARHVLADVKAPDDGRPVFEALLSRDDAFQGRFAARLPDLVMIPRRDEYVYNERPGFGEIIVPADSTTGTHARDGIFIGWGRGIKQGIELTQKPHLRDVGPTALVSLELPLTEDMDGRALVEAFESDVSITRSGSSYHAGLPGSDLPSSPVYSESEESELRERLRGLGYME